MKNTTHNLKMGAIPGIVPVDEAGEVLPAYRGTPVEMLLLYHNLGYPLPETTGHAHLLISMCMDHRKDLVIPNEFAYVLRSAGGNLRDSMFEVSYAIAVGNVAIVALLAHTDCGMVDVTRKRSTFVEGLVERGGWNQKTAEEHFDRCAAHYQIGDAVTFVCQEAIHLRKIYPLVLFAPLLYDVDTDRLFQVDEQHITPT